MQRLSNTPLLYRRGRGLRRVTECLLCATAFVAVLAAGARAQVPHPSSGEINSVQLCFYECKPGPTVRGVTDAAECGRPSRLAAIDEGRRFQDAPDGRGRPLQPFQLGPTLEPQPVRCMGWHR